MHSPRYPATALAFAVAAVSGCTSLPPERGYQEASTLVDNRLGEAPRWSADASAGAPAIPTSPISASEAVRLAFDNNPRVREEFARLGLGRAEFEQARRISNPTFGYARLRPESGGGGSKITQSLSIGLSDLLLLPATKGFAAGELKRLQNSVAAALLELASEAEVAWFKAVSANQVVAMRELVAVAAQASAELAQRFFDAGNINRLQLEQELAAAAQARIAAVRAGADALQARSDLAAKMGLPMSAAWRLHERLPAPPGDTFSADKLVSMALDQRLDLAAAQQELALRESTLGVSRRWRWLGSVEAGYERERELDGEVLRGPTLSLELPIFNQGQAAITRARAEQVAARARLDALVFTVSNDARTSLERMTVAREIAERYRTILLPSREAIVARSQEQVNFMLIGVFELILAKQQQYDAYQEYLEAVRDYWTARAELKRAVGGKLSDDHSTPELTIGINAMLPPTSAPAMDHSKMDHSKMSMRAEPDAPADHSKMDHSKMSMPAEPDAPVDHSKMDHSKMSMPEADAKADNPASPNPPAPAPKPEDELAPESPASHDHGDTP